MKKQKRKQTCSRCGKHKENKGPYCVTCNIKSLREYAGEIKRLKEDVRAGLVEEKNIALWDSWTSQRKKIAIFQLMENGGINWKIQKPPAK